MPGPETDSNSSGVFQLAQQENHTTLHPRNPLLEPQNGFPKMRLGHVFQVGDAKMILRSRHFSHRKDPRPKLHGCQRR